jgi:hypothetical protein
MEETQCRYVAVHGVRKGERCQDAPYEDCEGYCEKHHPGVCIVTKAPGMASQDIPDIFTEDLITQVPETTIQGRHEHYWPALRVFFTHDPVSKVNKVTGFNRGYMYEGTLHADKVMTCSANIYNYLTRIGFVMDGITSE